MMNMVQTTIKLASGERIELSTFRFGDDIASLGTCPDKKCGRKSP
jgi:hypothetical protein